jgi:hypothetical protein
MKTFSWPVVEPYGNCFQRVGGVGVQVAAFREILPQQAVPVFVASPLPRSARADEEHAVVEEKAILS